MASSCIVKADDNDINLSGLGKRRRGDRSDVASAGGLETISEEEGDEQEGEEEEE